MARTKEVPGVVSELDKNLGFGIYGVTYFTIVCYKFSGVFGMPDKRLRPHF